MRTSSHRLLRPLRCFLAVDFPTLLVAVFGAAAAPAATSGARTAVFRTVPDVPGAALTGLSSVNSRGTLVGPWFDSGGAVFGWIEQPGGQPITFNYREPQA
jgi:hypothetical protein